MADGRAKIWWAPVWRGLVVDAEAKHIRRLDGAIWLLLFCFLHADWRTGIVRWRTDSIARAMHVPRRTVQRWLGRLQRWGYVSGTKTGKGTGFAISNWRPIGRHATDGVASRQAWRGLRQG